MVVVEEWVCWVSDLGLLLLLDDEEGGAGAWGVEGWDSVSESLSQAMSSSGEERAAPDDLEWSSQRWEEGGFFVVWLGRLKVYTF